VKGLEFYSASAQIIPILFLVLVFELRFFAVPREPHRYHYVAALAYFLLIGSAEGSALRAVQDGKASGYEDDLVWIALNLLWVGIVGAPVWALRQGGRRLRR
jgi:hypothetical protein